MSLKKIIYASLITFLVIILTSFLLLKTNFVKKILPSNTKTTIKNFLFENIFEKQANYIKELESKKLRFIEFDKIQDTISEYGLIFFQYFDKDIKIDETVYNLKKFKTFQLINGVDPTYAYGSSFIEFYNDKLFLVTSDGKITFTKNLNLEKLVFQEISSNFEKIVKYDEFYDYNQLTVKDLFIFKNKLYLSYSNILKKDCYNTSILEADLNLNFLTFKKFFEPKDCVKKNNPDLEFNAVQSGGRMFQYKENKMLFTTGDYRYRKLAQDLNSTFGKILEINLENGDYEVVSYGHRNPQGLYYDTFKNYIISTEHGPKGGDEVNINFEPNKSIKNFGWPQASYGEHYSIKEGKDNPINIKKYKKYPLYKSHKKYGYEEPKKYFVPSIGISQLIKVDSNENVTFFVTSMRAKTIFKLKLDNQLNILDESKFLIGERIRDIIKVNDNKIIMFLENTPSLAILEKR